MDLEKIISYFTQLNMIPRASGDEKAASDFIVEFAKGLGLWVKQDEYNNVLVKKPGTEGMEDKPAVILQGHLDMVYVKDEDSDHVYENGIEMLDDGEFLTANGTTLGADNGIAVAFAMMLMASENVVHPPLEFIFTVEEEIGLLGAAALDVSELTGKAVLNMDSEEEGVFTTGCAGAVRDVLKLHIVREEKEGEFVPVEVAIGGLKGGHSGAEIHLERGNAIQMLGRMINGMKEDNLFVDHAFTRGQSNVIANNARFTCYLKAEEVEAFTAKVKEYEKMFQNELAFSDTVVIAVNVKEAVSGCNVYSKETLATLGNVLMSLPQGVSNMSMAVKGLVQTSMNTGSLEEVDGNLEISGLLRSSVDSQKEFLRAKVQVIADTYGLDTEWIGDYPGWQYKEESRLRDVATETYEKLFGKKAVAEAIHAGLECGYWAEKIENVDLLSIGPDMKDVHSTNEKVSKQSIANTWELLKGILAAY